MKQIIRPMVVLGVICIVCGGLLGIVESVTREPIAVQEETFKVTVSNGIVNITSPEQARFAIVDINGTTIIKGNINKGENAIDMNHSTGVFIITIESCNKVSTHKIII